MPTSSDTVSTPSKWNPNYVAFARAHGRTPDAQAQFDRAKWPGGQMTGFLLWVSQQVREAYAAGAGGVVQDRNGLHVTGQEAWAAWLGRPGASRIPDDPLMAPGS